jgi:hypothetical protein
LTATVLAMNFLEGEIAVTDPRRLALEGQRTADRLRSMSLVKVAAPDSTGAPSSEVVHRLAQEFADEAADLAGHPRRTLPPLPDRAIGDVLAVCVNDLVAELCVLSLDIREPVCEHAVAQLRQLRRAL